MDLVQQQQQSVAYFMVTEDQLRQVAEEGARFVLEKYGINTDEIREKMVINDKDEYRPVSYWLKKMGVARTTIWRWVQKGLIEPKYVGKKVFFRQRDFDEMFAKSKTEGA